MTKTLKALPKRIYVKLEAPANDPAHPYLVADVSIEAMADREVVGIYELKETRTLHVTRELK